MNRTIKDFAKSDLRRKGTSRRAARKNYKLFLSRCRRADAFSKALTAEFFGW